MLGVEQEIGRLLREKGLTLGAVESATGGLVSHLMTNVTGISHSYKGSVTAYANETKVRLIGVTEETLKQHGAVSAPVAEAMARGGREKLNVDICVSDTGIAGPGGESADKPVGLFYIGLSHKGGTFNRRHVFTGDREQNKRSAAEAALSWVKEYLENLA